MKLNITKEDKMLRMACISKLGTTYSLNGTKEEIDTLLLEIEGREGLQVYKIIDKDTKQVIETQDGVKNKGDN